MNAVTTSKNVLKLSMTAVKSLRVGPLLATGGSKWPELNRLFTRSMMVTIKGCWPCFDG